MSVTGRRVGLVCRPSRSRIKVLCGGGNATLGASYQSSLVRGNMSTCAVQSSDALAGVRESSADKKGKGTGIVLGNRNRKETGSNEWW